MDRPKTRYATTEDGVHIAYQVVGDGPIDLVFVHAFVSHVELFWELPSFERFVRELSSWARVIQFDKRGVGLSDRLTVVPTLEARLDDLRAVLDEVDSERTLVIGNKDSGALAALFAATYPDRTIGLALWSGGVRTARASDYPCPTRTSGPSVALGRRHAEPPGLDLSASDSDFIHIRFAGMCARGLETARLVRFWPAASSGEAAGHSGDRSF